MREGSPSCTGIIHDAPSLDIRVGPERYDSHQTVVHAVRAKRMVLLVLTVISTRTERVNAECRLMYTRETNATETAVTTSSTAPASSQLSGMCSVVRKLD